MKALVVYSSRTGNTRKIAEAIAAVLPGCEIHPVESLPRLKGTICRRSYWVDKGMPDAQAKLIWKRCATTNVALFGTLGAWPDSDHARDCIAQGEALVERLPSGGTRCSALPVSGQGRSEDRRMMQKVASDVHPMTPERKARLEEAAKHPDEPTASGRRKPSRGLRDRCLTARNINGASAPKPEGGSAAPYIVFRKRS